MAVEEEEEWVLLPRETQTLSGQPCSSTRQEVEEEEDWEIGRASCRERVYQWV